MSTWIYVTNLPLYYDEIAVKDIFTNIGPIVTAKVSQDKLLIKSTAIIQFSNCKHAKLAASKRDNTIIDKAAIRVFIIWCNKEDLSTLKVTNILSNSNIQDLEKHFNPFGDIVHIELIPVIPPNNGLPPLPSSSIYALITFSRIDYALRAAQEMNETIIALDHSLCVTLMNPDARNLQWKRHTFEYIALNQQFQCVAPLTPEPDDTLYSKENDIISLSSLSSSCTKSRQSSSSNISSNEGCADPTASLPDAVHVDTDLIVYGYIRPLIPNDSLNHICDLTLFYLHPNDKQPLYLRDPSIPPPPQRLPPCPPLPVPATLDFVAVPVAVATLNEQHQRHSSTTVPYAELEEAATAAATAISLSEIEGRYQQIFDIYRDRLEVIENRMTVLKGEFETIAVGMSRTLVSLEHRRINDINTIQKQFNSTITALCYQINNQINNQIIKITHKMESSRQENQARIHALESQMSQLKTENNMLRKQNKISKILAQKGGVAPGVEEEEKLKSWLFETVKLPQYLSVLVNNGYDDLESIHDITFTELQTVGINKMGHRKKLIKYAAMLGGHGGGGAKAKHVSGGGKMSPSSANSANSALMYTTHNIWSDDSVSSLPWNGNCYHSQGSRSHSRGDKTQIDGP